MAATASIDAIEWLRKQIEEAAPDPLKAMLTTMVSALMSAEVDAVCGAGYGERNADRANSRNGYRVRPWDTRVGSIDLPIPRLRQGSSFPTGVDPIPWRVSGVDPFPRSPGGFVGQAATSWPLS